MAITPEVISTVSKYAKEYNVDPYLILAIGQLETGWGDLGQGKQGMYLGYGSYDSGSDYSYAGLENQIKNGASKLSQWGARPGQVNLTLLKKGNSNQLPSGIWATDQKWPEKIWAHYQTLSKGNYFGTQTSVFDDLPKSEHYVSGGSISEGHFPSLPSIEETIAENEGAEWQKEHSFANEVSNSILGVGDRIEDSLLTAVVYVGMVVVLIFAAYMAFGKILPNPVNAIKSLKGGD